MNRSETVSISSTDEWWPLAGYQGYYEINRKGQIRSLIKGRRQGQILREQSGGGPYKRIRLAKDGVVSNHYIHRLVALTFLPNPEELSQVNHKDGNHTNNCVDNLEWSSPSDNQKHAYRVLKRTVTRGSKVGRSKLLEHEVAAIKRRIRQGETNASIACDFGVDGRTISEIKVGRTWTHIPWPADANGGQS